MTYRVQFDLPNFVRFYFNVRHRVSEEAPVKIAVCSAELLGIRLVKGYQRADEYVVGRLPSLVLRPVNILVPIALFDTAKGNTMMRREGAAATE